jgi:hypothetical protein
VPKNVVLICVQKEDTSYITAGASGSVVG